MMKRVFAEGNWPPFCLMLSGTGQNTIVPSVSPGAAEYLKGIKYIGGGFHMAL